MGKMLSSTPLTLPQRFSLIEEVGAGGMAVVYRGHDHHLDRPVAIKVLREELCSGLEVARFQREIGMTAKLVHPGIVALFDSGESDGRLYYVMPYVSGDTLRARLARERRLASKDAANIGADVAEALAYAHGAGIVHRDIKPENVFWWSSARCWRTSASRARPRTAAMPMAVLSRGWSSAPWPT